MKDLHDGQLGVRLPEARTGNFATRRARSRVPRESADREISSRRSEISWRGSLGESALGAVGAIALTLLMSARAAFALPVTCTRDKLGGEVVSSTNCPSDRRDYRKRRRSRGFRARSTRAKSGCRRRRIAARNRSWPTRAGADFGFCSWLEHRRRYLATTD